MSDYLRTMVAIPLFSVLILGAAGCGKNEEPKTTTQAPAPAAETKAPPPAPAAEPKTPEQAPVTAQPGAPQAPAPAAQPAPQATPAKQAIATADGEKPGVRVEVTELKRVSGGTVMLRFAMINEADKEVSFGYDFAQKGTNDFANIGGVHLVEPVGKKKYLVVRDSQGACDCSQGLSRVAANSRMNLWARFPAPPDNVEKIAVVIPHFSPMDDVPLSK
jgi:hypothetical protein